MSLATRILLSVDDEFMIYFIRVRRRSSALSSADPPRIRIDAPPPPRQRIHQHRTFRPASRQDYDVRGYAAVCSFQERRNRRRATEVYASRLKQYEFLNIITI